MLSTRRLVLALALIASSAPLAHAQINLAWNDCLGQSSATANIQYACDGSRNGIPFRLVPSFKPPVTLFHFVAVQIVLDLRTDAPCDHCSSGLSDWWRLGIGECRDGNLAFPASLTGIGTGTTGACRNPWFGAATGGGFDWGYYLGSDYARLILAFARNTETTVVGGQQYFAGVATLDTYGDIATEGFGACSGCCDRRALQLSRIELYQTAGSPGGDVTMLTSQDIRQYVHWQQSPALCATPTRPTTWGSIKTTYR